MAEAPSFEKALTDSGTIIIKLWLEVSDAEQERRFQDRLRRSWKRWKLSPMDLFARSRWTEYAKARDAMLKRTDSKHAPWWCAPPQQRSRKRNAADWRCFAPAGCLTAITSSWRT
jgi:polyphosphate kinase 2 (PPK2 family)